MMPNKQKAQRCRVPSHVQIRACRQPHHHPLPGFPTPPQWNRHHQSTTLKLVITAPPATEIRQVVPPSRAEPRQPQLSTGLIVRHAHRPHSQMGAQASQSDMRAGLAVRHALRSHTQMCAQASVTFARVSGSVTLACAALREVSHVCQSSGNAPQSRQCSPP